MIDAAGEWDVKRPAGWTPTEMFAHVASTIGLTPKIGPGILAIPPGVDIIEGLDIAAFNAQGVERTHSTDSQEAVEKIARYCTRMADWVGTLTDDQLEGEHTFRGMRMTMSNYLMTVTVMHSIHHLFEAPLSVPA